MLAMIPPLDQRPALCTVLSSRRPLDALNHLSFAGNPKFAGRDCYAPLPDQIPRLSALTLKVDVWPRDPAYSLLAVQRPLQPSARLYEPLPLLPDIFPVAVRATPSSLTLVER
jgi:hypothetical protein